MKVKKYRYENFELLEDRRVSISNFIKKIMATKTGINSVF